MELVAVQHGLAAELLQLLVAAVVCQAASGGQTTGRRVKGLTCRWVLGGQLEERTHPPPPMGEKAPKVGKDIPEGLKNNINNI